jgi:hypothetical protein
MPEAEQVVCSECHTRIGTVKCKGSPSQHLICGPCSQMTITRAKRESFYCQYVNWCDACIWFDIG